MTVFVDLLTQIAVQNVDGSRYDRGRSRLLHIQVSVRSAAGVHTHSMDRLIPDSSIVTAQYTPDATADFVTVRVCVCWRHHGRRYMYIFLDTLLQLIVWFDSH